MESRAFGKALRSFLPHPGLSGLRRTGLFSSLSLPEGEGRTLAIPVPRTGGQLRKIRSRSGSFADSLPVSLIRIIFSPQVFHSFEGREIGFSVARGDPDVALTGDFGGDTRVFHFVFQRPVENSFSGLFQAESFPQPVEITVDKRQR